jgi:hypothetical protein
MARINFEKEQVTRPKVNVGVGKGRTEWPMFRPNEENNAFDIAVTATEGPEKAENERNCTNIPN